MKDDFTVNFKRIIRSETKFKTQIKIVQKNRQKERETNHFQKN